MGACKRPRGGLFIALSEIHHPIVGNIIVQLGCARRQRIFGPGDKRKVFVVNSNRFNRILCNRLRIGHHTGERFAHKANFALRQNRPIGFDQGFAVAAIDRKLSRQRPGTGRLGILTGEDQMNTRQRLCRADIDRHDAGVCTIRAQKRRMQLTGQDSIGGEKTLTRDQAMVFNAASEAGGIIVQEIRSASMRGDGKDTKADGVVSEDLQQKRTLIERICENAGMNDLGAAFIQAAHLLAGREPALLGVIVLSLRVSLSALLIASLIGAPCGALLAVCRFPGRRLLIVAFNAMMGLPPVVVGLLIYILLSRAGPLGPFGLLFTPAAMVMAQSVLIVPIIIALTRQVIANDWEEYAELLRSLGARWWQIIPTLLWEARQALLTVLLAGFGRAVADVGAVMMVGGNIDGLTRVRTTPIALETSKGNLAFALALGTVLLVLVFLVNALAYLSRPHSAQHGI